MNSLRNIAIRGINSTLNYTCKINNIEGLHMKITRALKLFLPALLVAFVFTNCDMKESSVGTFDDVAGKLPNFTVMEGAEEVTVRVRRNNDRAYFNINLSNLGREAAILDGDYLGWCAHWSAPIDTRGEAYENITLYSTRNDKNWNKLNYLLNNRSRFYNEIDGAGYKEIQAVIWALIEFKEFDIDRNRIFDDLNRAAFDAILDDVRENGDDFEHTPLTTHAIFADMSVHVSGDDATQTVIVEGTAWAWAAPHTINSNSFGLYNFDGRWGWVTYYWFYEVDENGVAGEEFGPNNKLEAGLYADCGFGSLDNPEPEDIAGCPQVADVYIWHDMDYLYIDIENRYPEIGYSLTKLSYHLGTSLPSSLAIGRLIFKKEADGNYDFSLSLKHSLSALGISEIPPAPDVSDFDVNPPIPPLYLLMHGDTN